MRCAHRDEVGQAAVFGEASCRPQSMGPMDVAAAVQRQLFDAAASCGRDQTVEHRPTESLILVCRCHREQTRSSADRYGHFGALVRALLTKD